MYRVLVGKPEGNRPLGRARRRWEDNIKMNLSGSGMWGYGLNRADWDRWWTLVNAVTNLRFPLNAGNFLTNLKKC
jgi:hypothetical protein